mgnify:CR=1 FL=1
MSKTINIEEIKIMIEEIVENKLLELLGDPDQGLELSPEVRMRLKKSLLKKTGGISAEKISKELGLRW